MLRRFRIKRLPTDRELLEEIYSRYNDTFVDYSREAPTRETKILVPLDLDALADRFEVDPDIIFGRLYYHLDRKYGYKTGERSVHFFTPVAGKDRHCINFPLATSVLAGMHQEERKFIWVTSIAVFSLVVSIVSVVIAVMSS